MKARMWAFYIYNGSGERVGLEAWMGRQSADIERDKWHSRGYQTGKLFRQ